MAQETSKRNHEQEITDDVKRIFDELISSARGARNKPIRIIPVTLVTNNSWRSWEVIAQLGEHPLNYRIPMRTCGFETLSAAIHKYKESRGDVNISNIKASHDGDSWLLSIETSNED